MTAPTSGDYPAHLRAMVEAATPGPWGEARAYIQGARGSAVASLIGPDGIAPRDATLIAAAPDLALKLADAVETLEHLAQAGLGYRAGSLETIRALAMQSLAHITEDGS